MAITLTPEQEEQVRHDSAVLGFSRVEDYLAEQLQQIHEREVFFAQNREEISAMIEEGWAEAERGEVFTEEEVKEELAKAKKEFFAQRSAA